MGELPASTVGLSVVEKSNPASDWPTGIALEEATHSIEVPSKVLPDPFRELVQPVGLETLVGTDGRKSSPGIQPIQNVPTVVLPVLVTVTS